MNERDMKTIRQMYVLQDRLTKERKMYKFMTPEESRTANRFLNGYSSSSRWILGSSKKRGLKVTESATSY